MGKPRFKSINATPPGGMYEYSLNGRLVRSRSRIDIARQVKYLHHKAGLPVLGDGFPHVMDYMCPHLPNGFCTEPTKIKSAQVHEVKQRTQTLFGMRLLPADEIQRREEICIACPKHQHRGFCPSCTGLHTWVKAGFGGHRPDIPHDIACGACPEDNYLITASASVADLPETEGADYPENCWRRQPKEDTHGSTEEK